MPRPSHRLAFSALLLSTTLLGCRSVAPKTSEGPEDFAAIGDAIIVHAADDPDLCCSGLVQIDGNVTLPRIGAVEVAGLTASEIQDALASRQGAQEPPRLLVSIEHKAATFYVFGEVLAPAEQECSRDLTLFEAVIGSNPKPGSADLKRVRLIRRGQTSRTVNIGEVLESGDSRFNVDVKPGDIIIVPLADPAEGPQ